MKGGNIMRLYIFIFAIFTCIANAASILETDRFLIKIESNCEEGNVACGDISYTGIRKSDGAKIHLKGKTLNKDCEKSTCDFYGYIFKNGNYTYTIHARSSASLTIEENGKVILYEDGVLSSDIALFDNFRANKVDGVNLRKKIIYEFKEYPEDILSIDYSLNDFFKYNGVAYDENNKLNKLFNSNTMLNEPIKHRKSYKGDAVFFKEIVNDKNLKLLLFSYWDHSDQDSYLNLPTIELQIFDSNYSFLDKIIVVDGASAECSIKKTFKIYDNMSFDITDTEGCWDMDTDKFILNMEKRTTYIINSNGRIQKAPN